MRACTMENAAGEVRGVGGGRVQHKSCCKYHLQYVCYTLPFRGNEVGGVGGVRFKSLSVASTRPTQQHL